MCWVWISQTKLIKVKFIAKQAPTHFRPLIAAVRLYSCDVTHYPFEMSEANLGHIWMSHEKEKDLCVHFPLPHVSRVVSDIACPSRSPGGRWILLSNIWHILIFQQNNSSANHTKARWL